MSERSMSGLSIVMVTGSSRGLGKAIACELASEHRVIGVARGEWQGEKPANIEHRAGIDLGQIEHIDALVPLLAECDVLINNAACSI